MISDFFLFCHAFLADAECALHDAGHCLGLRTVAGAPDGAHPLFPLLAVGGQYLGYPQGIIVGDVSQVAGHGEDEVVPRTDVRLSAHLFFEHLDDETVVQVFVGRGK